MDLSRKASITSVDVPAAEAMEADESEDDAPLDLKVRPDSSSKSRMPAYPTLAMPGPQQRAELLRIAELYTSGSTGMTAVPPPSSRESSQERGKTPNLLGLLNGGVNLCSFGMELECFMIAHFIFKQIRTCVSSVVRTVRVPISTQLTIRKASAIEVPSHAPCVPRRSRSIVNTKLTRRPIKR